jgi:hypothetical protein
VGNQVAAVWGLPVGGWAGCCVWGQGAQEGPLTGGFVVRAGGWLWLWVGGRGVSKMATRLCRQAPNYPALVPASVHC